MKLNHLLTFLLMETDKSVVCVTPSLTRPPIIAVMGTRSIGDLLSDVNIRPRYWPTGAKDAGFVHGGFAKHAKKILKRQDVIEFVNEYPEPIVAGHSMGGAAAALIASSLVFEGKSVKSVHTFGAPRMVTQNFLDFYNKQGIGSRTWRYVVRGDPVSTFSPIYKHVGNEVILDSPQKGINLKNHDLSSYRIATDDLPSNTNEWMAWP